MHTEIHHTWKTVLEEEFLKPYYKDLTHFVENECIACEKTMRKYN